MNQVDEYINQLADPQQTIARHIRTLIRDNFPDLQENLKWSRPVYEIDSRGIVYFVATNSGVNLGFNQGSSLKDPKDQLQGSGKDMRHIKLSAVDDIDADYFSHLIRQSLDLV